MQSSDSTKFQGDALDEQKWRSVSSAWKNELENRPVDSDLEKKQGDPLLEALPSVPTEEPIHTGKLARELPEYHQGEARSLKDLTAESPMDLQEKSLQDLAHDLADKARDGEKYLEEQLIAGETFVENSVAPVVSSLLSSAYSAVAAATSMAIEKGKDGLHYLGKEAYELSDTMAEKTDDAIVKAKEVLSEGAHIAAEKSSQTAEYLSQKTEEIIHSAADKAQKTIETLVDAQYGAPVEYGTQGTPLSAEGFQDLEKAIKTFERSASFHLEQAQAEAHQEAQPSEAAQTLRDLADASEEEKLAKERALDFMKRENEEAEELRQIQMRAISEEKKIQREKTFVRSISQDLTESLRASASAYEKKIELEGASSSELRPLLGEEPMSQVTV